MSDPCHTWYATVPTMTLDRITKEFLLHILSVAGTSTHAALWNYLRDSSVPAMFQQTLGRVRFTIELVVAEIGRTLGRVENTLL